MDGTGDDVHPALRCGSDQAARHHHPEGELGTSTDQPICDMMNLRLLLATGDANACDAKGYPALMLAAHSGETTIVEMLLQAGADVCKGGTDNITALSVAAAGGHMDIIDLLLAHGADPSIKTRSRPANALDCAAVSGSLGAVKRLLEVAPELGRGKDGVRALYMAAAGDKLDVFEALLQHGADARATIDREVGLESLVDDKAVRFGISLLTVVALNNRPRAVELLCQYGADPTVKDKLGWTALDHIEKNAVLKHDKILIGMVKKCVRDFSKKAEEEVSLAGAAPTGMEEALEGGSDLPALCCAAFAGDVNETRRILEVLGSGLLQASGGNKPSPLHYAAASGLSGAATTARLLLERGGLQLLNVKDGEGRTVLDMATGPAKAFLDKVAACRQASFQLDQLQLGALLGRGAFGYVYALTETPPLLQGEASTGCCVKLIDLNRWGGASADRSDLLTELRRELKILQSIYHPRVVRCLGVVEVSLHATLGEVYGLVMERLDEDAEHYLHRARSSPDWSPDSARKLLLGVAVDVAEGLWALHEHPLHIVHRDLHMKNVLMRQGRAVLGDMGKGKLLAEYATKRHSDTPGRLDIVPPEAWGDGWSRRSYDASYDMYGFGWLIARMVVWAAKPGNNQWRGSVADDDPDIMAAQKQGLLDLALGSLAALNLAGIKDPLESLVQADPKLRMSAKEVRDTLQRLPAF